MISPRRFPGCDLPTLSAALIAAAMSIPSLSTAEETRNLGEYLPMQTHIALWVDDIEDVKEEMGSNGFVQLLMNEETGVGDGPNAISRTMQRIPMSGADPLFSLWTNLFPFVDAGLRNSMDSATTVLNFTAADLDETFSGSIALYSTMYDLYVENNIEIVEWDVVLAATYEKDEKEAVDRFLEKALARVPEDARKKSVTYSGHEVYHLTYYLDEEASLPGDNRDMDLPLIQEIPVIVEYGFVDGVFLLAEGRGEPLKRAVRALTNEGEPLRLSTQSRFQQARRALGEKKNAFHFYYDIQHHTRELDDFPSRKATGRMFEGIGLHRAGPLLSDISLDESGARIESVIPLPPDSPGLLSAVVNSPENDLGKLSYIPADAGLAGSLTFDFSELYKSYRDVMLAGSPAGQAALDTGITYLQTMLNVNLEEDIIKKAAGELVCYVRESAADENDKEPRYVSAYFIPHTGGTDTVDVVNRVMKGLNEGNMRLLDMESSDFNGNTIWESRSSAIASTRVPGMHICATPTGLAVSNTGAELRELLRRISGSDGESIESLEEFQKFREKLPQEGLRGFVYLPAETVIRDYMHRSRMTPKPGAAGIKIPRSEIAEKLGPSWWTLSSEDGILRFTFSVDTPSASE